MLDLMVLLKRHTKHIKYDDNVNINIDAHTIL